MYVCVYISPIDIYGKERLKVMTKQLLVCFHQLVYFHWIVESADKQEKHIRIYVSLKIMQ